MRWWYVVVVALAMLFIGAVVGWYYSVVSSRRAIEQLESAAAIITRGIAEAEERVRALEAENQRALSRQRELVARAERIERENLDLRDEVAGIRERNQRAIDLAERAKRDIAESGDALDRFDRIIDGLIALVDVVLAGSGGGDPVRGFGAAER